MQPSIRALPGIVAVLLSIAALGCNAVLGLEERPLAGDGSLSDTGAVEDAYIDSDDFNPEDASDDTTIGSADTVAVLDDARTATPDTTAAPDTTIAPPDTGPSDAATDTSIGAVLIGTSAVVSSTAKLDLTAEGTLDWAHWGHPTVSSFNHRIGAGLIGKGTTIGAAYAYGMYPKVFSWSDGTPTLTASSDEGIAFLTTGDGFTIDAPASTTKARTLRVYSVWNRCTGTVAATLSDGSAPASMGTAPPASSELRYVVFIYTFRAEKAGARLTVKMLRGGAGSGAGLNALSLTAATLQ